MKANVYDEGRVPAVPQPKESGKPAPQQSQSRRREDVRQSGS